MKLRTKWRPEYLLALQKIEGSPFFYDPLDAERLRRRCIATTNTLACASEIASEYQAYQARLARLREVWVSWDGIRGRDARANLVRGAAKTHAWARRWARFVAMGMTVTVVDGVPRAESHEVEV